MSLILDVAETIIDYFKFILGFFICMFLLILVLVPIGNYIPPFNDWLPFLKGLSIVQWLQQYTLVIIYGIIIATPLFILFKYKSS